MKSHLHIVCTGLALTGLLALLGRLLAIPIAAHSDHLPAAYENAFKGDLQQASGYGMALFFFAIVLVLYMVNVMRRHRASVMDITERRNLEAQLAHAQKLESIGQLAAGIAHEINTPIQYIGDNVTFLKDAFAGFHEILDKHEAFMARVKSGTLEERAIAQLEEAMTGADLQYLNEEVPRAIAQTLEGVGRVAKIVRAMKEFSHPGTEGKVPSDINKLIETTVTVAQNEWKYVAEMVTDLDGCVPFIPCVAGEFNQVILNLIVNAAHAIGQAAESESTRKGVISISTRALPDFVEIRVQDTGSGIPDGIRGKVFEPFFTTKPVGKGTGQGLAIARTVIVKKHGGTLTFETETGKGTTFIIHLPYDQEVISDKPTRREVRSARKPALATR